MHRWANKKDMAGDDPPYLTVGTEVSAKYKGAFCEAKIRKVVKTVKCKVQYKHEQGSAFVNDDQIKGLLMPGASIEVKQPEKKESVEGTIVKIQDLSQYTVVFDDGDIATLRRTALCLKSGRHFAESETLDQLPLTHPEHFSTPVVSGARGSRRRDDMDDNSDDEDKRETKIEREEDMGKVVCVEIGDKKKSKDNWFPGLIVAPNAQDSVKIDVEDEYLVRSFKDGRYYTVPKTETVEFTREVGGKVENQTLKQAVEKAISFLDRSDLPPHWDRDQLFGMADFPSDIDASDTDSMDDEPREEKDHFVAQLYKFMDDRGTPINKGPVISSKDVDLYKLFKIVYKLGGYNRVTNRNQWKSVAMKLDYNANQTNNVKSSYKKYLHSFEDFYRKLGCTLLTTSRDNKLRSRSNRSLIRDRDKALPDKLLDKEDSSLSNHEDSVCDLKEANGVKMKLINAQDEEVVESKQCEIEKDVVKPKHKDHSTENMKEEDKLKKKLDSNTTKDAGVVQLVNFKEAKDEKLTSEKRTERKSVKSVLKPDEPSEKKADKLLMKTKTKKSKPVERRIKKTESTLSQLKEKRSLKERMKAIVHKLKLKSANLNDQEKKKQKPADVELNKLLQHGVKVRLKDEFANNVPKSRKLSVGSNDSKGSTSAGPNTEKKFAGSSSSASSVSDAGPGPSTAFSKFKKSDEETPENSKKKTASRKKRDDDKFSNNSAVSLLNLAIEFVPLYKTICIGDKLRVYYEPTHESKVTYEAKVTNKRKGGTVTEYLVHYTGWNTRYDEWIRRSRIADNLSWTPLRGKRKGNLSDSPTRNSTPAVPVEQPTQQNQNNNNKVPADKLKRSSMSPVAKNRTKNPIKTGLKHMKNVKSKFESKSKKASVQKDSDSGSESDSEGSQKRTLQKTRSRTEKKKQQDEESTVRDVAVQESKKTPPPLKRTRSGSIKLENKETTKKLKLSPSSKTTGKPGKPSSIRNSIMKSLVPRKRLSNRAKEPKEEKSAVELPVENDDVPENETVAYADEPKNVADEQEPKTEKCASSDESKDRDEKHLILKIKPISPERIAEFELTLENTESDAEANENESTLSSSEDTGPPVLKKEVLADEDVSPARSAPSQFLPGSYLSENLDTKPKIVKAKLKKDSDEKSASPSKPICRSPSEKLAPVAKQSAAGDVKEKTFFTSRSPSEKKNEKTPEKDGKLRNVSTFTSYLNMDKIECIKKVIEKSEKEKQSGPKTVDSVRTNEDDIYEFKEPEPFEFRAIDDRAILHRRSTPRIFEDANYKRTKMVASAADVIMREIDEPDKSPDEMNIVETKSILEATSTSDGDVGPVVEAADISVEKEEAIEMESPCVDAVESDEPVAVNQVDEPTKVDPMPVEVEVCKASSPDDVRLEKCLIPTLATTEEFEDSEFEESAEDDDDDDDDVEESKLVILENDTAAELTIEEPSSKPLFDEAKPVIRDIKLEVVDLFASSSAKSATESKESSRRSSSPDVKPLDIHSSSDNEEDTEPEIRSGLVDKLNDITKEPICQTPVQVDEDSCSEVSASKVSSEKENVRSSDDKSAKVIAKKLNADTRPTTVSSSKPSSTTSSKLKVDEKQIISADEPDPDQLTQADPTEEDTVVLPDGIVAEIEVSCTAVKKDVDEDLPEAEIDKNVESKSEKSETEHSKSKDDEDAVNDGLLLCEETIPKSPESKDTNDIDMAFSNNSRIAVGEEGKKLPHKQLAKLKKEPRSAFASPSSNAFENTPPSTPEESNSTPGTSPSEEISGFSSNTYSLHEKSCSNKDSSENETSSDASEKPVKMKKYSDEAYAKKNAYEFDTYLKRKAEQEAVFKGEECMKKKSKSSRSPSANGSDKEDFGGSGNGNGSSSKTVTSSQKSSVTDIIKQIPQDVDGNQRIEFLEQKLQDIRKAYNALRQEVASIDKRRRKLRRREREGRMMTRNEANSLL